MGIKKKINSSANLGTLRTPPGGEMYEGVKVLFDVDDVINTNSSNSISKNEKAIDNCCL